MPHSMASMSEKSLIPLFRCSRFLAVAMMHIIIEYEDVLHTCYIVSGDNHLLELKHFHGIQMVDAKIFVDQIKKR